MSSLKIDVRELEKKPLFLKGFSSFSDSDLNQSEVKVIGEISISLTVEKKPEVIQVTGSFDAKVQLICARCLELFSYPLAVKINQDYRSSSHQPSVGATTLKTEDTSIAFFSGDFIEVNDIICEQILLSVPMKPLCQENCQGLCSQCGQNKNHSNCTCEIIIVDPRLTPLLKLKN